MPPRPSDEIEGSRNLSLPTQVIDEARQNADAAGLTLRAYSGASHDVMWQLGQVGIGPNTFISTPSGPKPLPSLEIDPQPTKTAAIMITKRLLEQSRDYRQARNLSLAKYLGRTLVLLNGIYRLGAGSELELEQTIRPPHRATIGLPFKPRVRK